MKLQTVTLALPIMFILDICSGSVDIPWWAYLLILLGANVRWYRSY